MLKQCLVTSNKLTEVVKQENYTIDGIHRSYLKRTDTYIALEDGFDFAWEMKDVKEVEHMWNEGLSLPDMTVALNRDGDEVAILIMDRIRKGTIGERKGGIFGNRRVM